MRAFLRIILLIPLGLMAAIASAVVVYLAAFGFTSNDIWDGPNGEIPVILAPAFVLLVEISRYALLPFLVGIVVAEVFALRSAILWTLFGGAIGLGIHLAAKSTEFAALPPVAAGLVAGFAYWVIAGHGSGLAAQGRALTAPAERPTFPGPE